MFLSDSVWGNLELAVEAEVSSVPVATASQCQDIVSLHNSNNIIIALQPVVSRGVHPSNVMTTICGSSLVRHDTDQLVVSGVEA